jgi:hypothetical protein
MQLLENCKSPCSNKILAELIQVAGKILHSQIHKLSNSIWSKEEFVVINADFDVTDQFFFINRY